MTTPLADSRRQKLQQDKLLQFSVNVPRGTNGYTVQAVTDTGRISLGIGQ